MFVRVARGGGVPRLIHAAFQVVAFAASVRAGTVTGVVVEHSTSRPLARTVVRLEPLRGGVESAPRALVTRTSQGGQFVFPKAPPGVYLLTSTRSGFFPSAFGQRLPTGSGVPVTVTDDSSLFAELRMRRRGAIAGRVFDENGVGVGGVRVLAYRAKLPLRSAGSATSDDRGWFRLGGLDPGKYQVRSGGHVLEDGASWIPTFSPRDHEPRNAKVYEVAVDADTPDADLYPRQGQLFKLSGVALCEAPGGVRITLASETEQRSVQAKCSSDPAAFQFDDLPAGQYELLATSTDGVPGAAHLELTLGGNAVVNLTLTRPGDVDIEVARSSGTALLSDSGVSLLARRRSLSKPGEFRKIEASRVRLEPGYWEMRANPPASEYVQLIQNSHSGGRGRRTFALPDAFEVYIGAQGKNAIRVTLAGPAGKISGRVTSEGRVAPGAPVYVWPVTEAARRSSGGSRVTRADTDGEFEVGGLPPGEYRVLASFDVGEVDAEILDRASASTARVTEGGSTSLALALWTPPY